jgi:hypothetical protein
MSAINKIPEATIRKFQADAPVNVRALADVLGVKVWESRTLPPGISGKLFKDPTNGGTQGFSIQVNAADAFVRKRFTIAHELAHFILHRDKIGAVIMDDAWYRSGLSTQEEAEANRLAADILMPVHLIRRYLMLRQEDPTALAKRFQVSAAAMTTRIDEMGRNPIFA